jgi:hypothetical protein
MKSEADNALDVLLHAVDLEVIKQRTHVPSQTTRTREDFRQKLAQRDGENCVWTGLSGIGMGKFVYGPAYRVLECTSFLIAGAMRHVFLTFSCYMLTVCAVASAHH